MSISPELILGLETRPSLCRLKLQAKWFLFLHLRTFTFFSPPFPSTLVAKSMSLPSVKKCGRCDKTVYPTEELQCLDKVIKQDEKRTETRSICSFGTKVVWNAPSVKQHWMWRMCEATIECLTVKRRSFLTFTLSLNERLVSFSRHYPQLKPTVVVDNREM